VIRCSIAFTLFLGVTSGVKTMRIFDEWTRTRNTINVVAV
jgi:hypothetical protein